MELGISDGYDCYGWFRYYYGVDRLSIRWRRKFLMELQGCNSAVTTVTDGSGIYYGVDEPTYALADIGLENEGYYGQFVSTTVVESSLVNT